MSAVDAQVWRPEDLTSGWLSSVLGAAGVLPAGSEVKSFTVTAVGTGQMADTVRLVLETDGAGPASIVAKFSSADEQSRSTGLAMRAYEIEVGFYREVADLVRARMPRCLHAVYEEETGQFVLLLEDVTGAVQGEQLDGCSPDVATAALGEMAALHAPAWASPRLAALPWLHRASPASHEFTSSIVMPLLPGFLERYGDRLDPDHAALCERFIAVLPGWLGGATGPSTVVHGDFRLDNLLFRPGDPRPWVVDWQTASWGPPAGDVAYFIGGSLTTEDRRVHEERLTRSYHDALVARGVEDYPYRQFVAEYRRAAFGGILMAIGASMLVKRTDRGDAMFVTSVTRHAQHALDIGAEQELPGRIHD